MAIRIHVYVTCQFELVHAVGTLGRIFSLWSRHLWWGHQAIEM